MKVKILTLTLFLLGFSMSTQAQSAVTTENTKVQQSVKKVASEQTSTTPSNPSQQTKDNIRRKNMAKYKKMSSRKTQSNNAVKTERTNLRPRN